MTHSGGDVHARHIGLLQLTAAVANESDTFDEAAERCLGPLCRELGWSVGHVFRRPLRDSAAALQSSSLWWLDDPDRYAPLQEATSAVTLTPGIGLPGMVVELCQPVWLVEAAEATNLPRRDAVRSCGLRSALGVPVLSGRDVVAVIELFSTELRDQDPDVLAVLEGIGIQLGRVVERELRTSLLQVQAMGQTALAGIRSAFTECDELEAALRSAAQSCLECLGLRTVEVWLQPGGQANLELWARAGDDRSSPAIIDGGPDAAIHDAASASALRWHTESGSPEMLALPLEVDGALLGVLALFFGSAFNHTDLPVFEEAAGSVAAGIERWRMGEALVRSEGWFRSVVEQSSDIVIVTDDEGVVRYASPSFHRILGHGEERILGLNVFDLIHPDDLDESLLRLAKLISGRGADRPLIVRVADAKGRWRRLRAAASNLLENQEVGGILVTAVDITDLYRVERQLEHERTHDPLTGLPNRQQFVIETARALARATRNRWRTVVLCIDLDEFRLINEQFGHDAGDWVLIDVARRLTSTFRSSDGVARTDEGSAGDPVATRLDGDEFFLLCEGFSHEADVGSLVGRVNEALHRPVIVGDAEILLRASIGVTLTRADEEDVERTLQAAETSMHAAKARGGNCFAYYSDDLAREADERHATATELRYAVAKGELRLLYQPKISLTTGRVAGVEALVRWQHPSRGLLAPDAFIESAERSGLIVDIGAWVLREACSVGSHWSASAGDEGFLVCVNVSSRQFDQRLVTTVSEALNASGLEAHRLCLEVTESMLMTDIDAACDLLTELKAIGIKVSIDDFGTGYSSLAYLRRLPIDELKIDQSFVNGLGSDEGDTAIVAAIMGMAHAMGLLVIAEGVETPDQLSRLRDLGCDLGQGYLFSLPRPADEMGRFIADHAASGIEVGGSAHWVTESASPVVVVADDSPFIRKLAAVSLAAGGFTVHEAASGEETLELAQKVSADCFILDVMMEGLDGFETCRALRALPASRSATILMVTAKSSADDKALAFSLGADDYLVKPFTPRDLVARVRAARQRRLPNVGA